MPTITSGGASNAWEQEPVEEIQVVAESGPEIPAEELPAPKAVRRTRKAAQSAPEGA